jgi:hypothetical protein
MGNYRTRCPTSVTVSQLCGRSHAAELTVMRGETLIGYVFQGRPARTRLCLPLGRRGVARLFNAALTWADHHRRPI